MKIETASSETRQSPRRSGFTLIEVIAGLVLAAVLIAIMLPLFGSSILGGRDTVRSLPATQKLRTEMDALFQVYRTSYTEDLEGLSTVIDQRSWIANPAPTATVLTNNWVDFNNQGVEVAAQNGEKNVLKVTLGNAAGERLTSYFFPAR